MEGLLNIFLQYIWYLVTCVKQIYCCCFVYVCFQPVLYLYQTWLLLFSYIYLGEYGAYRMPAEPQPSVLSAKFVRGFLSVVEAASDSS